MTFVRAVLCSLMMWPAVCLAQEAGPKRSADVVRVSAIQARLFYESTGAFSENVLTERGVDLWNTPFDWTYSTFVVVELEGVPEYLKRPRLVELTARYIPYDVHGVRRRRVTLRQTEWVRNGSETGKAYAGFWLRNTGCEPVYLTARLAGRRQRLSATINFGCGE